MNTKTVSPVVCAAYITQRATVMRAVGMHYPSYREFLALYGTGKSHSVADIVDYLSVFISEY